MQHKSVRLNPLSLKAEGLARYYIPLKNKCELCGSKVWLERHHPDYSKPLEVQTLCRTCHARQRSKQSDNRCKCPDCGSTYTVKLGFRTTRQGRKQTRVCKDCGRGFYEAEHLLKKEAN
jgi:DNA-directed RNA polymerase subunit RPC12/RpoP